MNKKDIKTTVPEVLEKVQPLVQIQKTLPLALKDIEEKKEEITKEEAVVQEKSEEGTVEITKEEVEVAEVVSLVVPAVVKTKKLSKKSVETDELV